MTYAALKNLGRSPWRIVHHDGNEFMIRENDGATWIVRLPDRAVWLFDHDQVVPDWARPPTPQQRALF